MFNIFAYYLTVLPIMVLREFKKYLFYNLINLSVIHSVNDFKESIIDYRIWSLSQVRCALSLIYWTVNQAKRLIFPLLQLTDCALVSSLKPWSLSSVNRSLVKHIRDSLAYELNALCINSRNLIFSSSSKPLIKNRFYGYFTFYSLGPCLCSFHLRFSFSYQQQWRYNRRYSQNWCRD